MPTLLISNWRLFAVAGAVIAVFSGGMHYQSLVDARRADELVLAQQEADAKARAELDRKARTAELELAAERTRAAELADQWEKERHAANHVNCPLSSGTLRLLKAASGD